MVICRKKLLSGFIFIFLFFLFFFPIDTQAGVTEETIKLKEFKSQYPNTSNKYRGVVTMDANAGGIDELYIDFGSAGLWVYNTVNWTKLSPLNPEWIFAFEYSGTSYLVADFGSLGLWRWNFNGSWTGTWVKLTSSNAASAFAVDDDWDGNQELHVNFIPGGLWRYDLGMTPEWRKINSLYSSNESLRMDTVTSGYEEGAHSFSTAGSWRYFWNSGDSWGKLNDLPFEDDNASAKFTNGTAEDLVLDFDSTGLWLLQENDHSWHKLNSLPPLDLRAVNVPTTSGYELLASFGSAAGLWRWDYSGYPGTWTRINSATPDWDGGFCEPFDPDEDGNEEVVIDFGAVGLWQWEYTCNTWTKLSNLNPQFMVAYDSDGDGFLDSQVIDFGPTYGLWIYDGWNSTWTKLNALSPDGVY